MSKLIMLPQTRLLYKDDFFFLTDGQVCGGVGFRGSPLLFLLGMRKQYEIRS